MLEVFFKQLNALQTSHTLFAISSISLILMDNETEQRAEKPVLPPSQFGRVDRDLGREQYQALSIVVAHSASLKF